MIFIFVVAEEIAHAISSSTMGIADLYNDADLERELKLLAQEEIEQDLTTIASLPDVRHASRRVKGNQQMKAWAQSTATCIFISLNVLLFL